MPSTEKSRSQRPENLTQALRILGVSVERRGGSKLVFIRPRKKTSRSTENPTDKSETAEIIDDVEEEPAYQAPQSPISVPRATDQDTLTDRVVDAGYKPLVDPELDIPLRYHNNRSSDTLSARRYSRNLQSRRTEDFSNVPSAALCLYRPQTDTGANSPRSPHDERHSDTDRCDAGYSEPESNPGSSMVKHYRTKYVGCGYPGEEYPESESACDDSSQHATSENYGYENDGYRPAQDDSNSKGPERSIQDTEIIQELKYVERKSAKHKEPTKHIILDSKIFRVVRDLDMNPNAIKDAEVETIRGMENFERTTSDGFTTRCWRIDGKMHFVYKNRQGELVELSLMSDEEMEAAFQTREREIEMEQRELREYFKQRRGSDRHQREGRYARSNDGYEDEYWSGDEKFSEAGECDDRQRLDERPRRDYDRAERRKHGCHERV